ncbi:MAG: hypothetical protein JW891_13800 [Candidatus Lokiarchaeota archaeon]|nr:hypothetical protein [Candidatus Lokiarchaeota archaeon]
MNHKREILDKQKSSKWTKSSSIKRHDLYNFESKIDYRYSLERPHDKRKTSYLMDMYFFVPQALQINKEKYSKTQFYSDLNNKIRFKTPQMSIKGILDQKNDLSPLNVIKENLEKIEFGDNRIFLVKTITRELKLLASIVKTTLRDEYDFLVDYCKYNSKPDDISTTVQRDLDKLQQFKEEMRSIGRRLAKIQVPVELKDAFMYSSEYISLQLEKWSNHILLELNKQLIPNIKGLIINFIEDEQSYRASLNSKLIILEGSSNEEYSYFEGITKKYVQSVLYLIKKKKDPQSSSIQLFYSIAAGLAMFMSLFLGFLLLANFEENSFPFIIGAIIIYMLKDRIKDAIKGMAQKAASFLFPDRRVDIIDGFYGEKIGESKEKVGFTDHDKIPQEILMIRQSSNKDSIETEGKPEECILFRKKIDLYKKTIDKLHTRRKDISDITRFNIYNFLRYADDPQEQVLYWNRSEQLLKSMKISKEYHVNIVIKMTTFQEKSNINVYYKKYRIVLDQQGIKRVKELDFTL